ncbi:hypothetical protein B484DRAFT_457912 [Ochromonadaceae sp. CCMP2298]|nr:hypothetical protein B484DRAFT_457912 [Ochromonadaceae sp. CCMP2298]|eukprot:CAMPEP_0173186702 /NCGR_PEP_ID=MMETSP1141-20130122/10288_1 /TAXON_ID=483371 /ORGANISM="non described non described, Strain CCMP2298" /LENGTH=97 /DNA_ID=CAMNT_0014110433 /DNA_START=71 /DNA_END=364 /DNA_ORIENTATION=+
MFSIRLLLPTVAVRALTNVLGSRDSDRNPREDSTRPTETRNPTRGPTLKRTKNPTPQPTAPTSEASADPYHRTVASDAIINDALWAGLGQGLILPMH